MVFEFGGIVVIWMWYVVGGIGGGVFECGFS